MPSPNWTYEDRKYSGPGRTGICVCGHSWQEHHGNMVMNVDYYNATKEDHLPGACEHYGFNETEGMMYDKEKGEWIDHCSSYRDSGLERDGNYILNFRDL